MPQRSIVDLKKKYYEKTLSENAIMTTWTRLLDVEPLFTSYVWLNLAPFDLSQLGIGLLNAILPMDFQPLNIGFEFKIPTIDETLQGIWAKFGITPLGYGLLLPKDSIYKLIDGKKNPPFIKLLIDKMTRIKNSIIYTTYAYSNYNRPEEMIDPHKSDRTNQYALLHQMRRHIENWVYEQIPPEEANPLKIRQYQSAVLQMISWKAKRHRWGYQGWEAMSDEDFLEWWLRNWEAQGLNRQLLLKLQEGMKKGNVQGNNTTPTLFPKNRWRAS